jgi:hypothetical protein
MFVGTQKPPHCVTVCVNSSLQTEVGHAPAFFPRLILTSRRRVNGDQFAHRHAQDSIIKVALCISLEMRCERMFRHIKGDGVVELEMNKSGALPAGPQTSFSTPKRW